MKFLPIDPELEALSIIHIEWDSQVDTYWCKDCGQYHKLVDGPATHEPDLSYEFWERDELIITSNSFKLLTTYLRRELSGRLHDLSDSEILSIAITAEAEGMELSRSEALDNLLEFSYYLDYNPDLRYLAYI